MATTYEEQMSPEIVALDRASRVTRTPVEDGGTMVWREWGEGEPLLLLHGSHGGWMHFLRNIPELARSRRVIVPDIPGFGESDVPADLRSREDHAAAMVAGLRELVPQGAVDTIAFSLGATLACFMHFADPALLRRIIMVDAGGLDTPLRSPDLRPVRGLTGDAIRETNRHNLHAMMIHAPTRIDDTAIDISIYCGKRARTQVQYLVIPDKLLEALAKVRAPIDVIWAEHDYIHPDPELNTQVIRQHHPEAQLRVVPDAGHWPMYEQPEAFNAAALDLLSQPARPFLPE